MSTQHLIVDLGYALLGLVYVAAGALHFRHFNDVSTALSVRQIPAPRSVLAIGSVFQIIVGAMLAIQMDVRFSAVGLAVFTVVASLMLLDFWRQTGPARQATLSGWRTNIALIGALLVIGCR